MNKWQEFWKSPEENSLKLTKHQYESCQPEWFAHIWHVSTYLANLIDRKCPGVHKILEIGCNCGRNLVELERRGYMPYGIEINSELKMYPGLNVSFGPVEDLLYSQRWDDIDLILCQSVLMHLPPESEHVFQKMQEIAQMFIVTNEVERRDDLITFRRNYSKIFPNQIHHQIPTCGTIGGWTRIFDLRRHDG